MRRKLPKNTFRGLAKLLGPISLWMSAGWALVPVLNSKVDPGSGALDAWLVLTVYILAVIWLVIGLVLTIYGFAGSEVDDAEFDRLANLTIKCPYCYEDMLADADHCHKCRRDIPK